MRALVVGTGKMGAAIEAALAARGHAIAGRIGPLDTIEALDLPGGVEAAFEFTAPEAAPTRVRQLLRRGIPTVCGTTAWDVEPARALARETGTPFLWAPNFSIGVAALQEAVAWAARLLAAFPEFEPGLVERHHAAKKDAPSGTAKLLAKAVESARKGAVPVVSLRQGGQPGEHVVVFEGPDESVELVHRARSRAIFAAGAVRAAEWLVASGLKGPVTFEEFLASGRMR